MTPADPSLIEGASVGELLQQVEDQFYLLAVQPPSARALLSAWPDFAKASANLLRAVIGPSADQHLGVHRNPDIHPTVPAAVRLLTHLDQQFPTWTSVVPDPTMTRAARLLGAAADLVEAAQDRRHALAAQAGEPTPQSISLLRPPHLRRHLIQPQPDPAVAAGGLTDADRVAALLRAAQHTHAGVQLLATICGHARARRLKGAAGAEQLGLPRMAQTLHAGVLASRVLAAGDGHPVFGGYDAIRVPTLELVDPADLMARLKFTVHTWKQASLASPPQRPSIAEALRSTVEIRHLIGLNAALTHVAAATGLIPPERAKPTLETLLTAQRAWGQVTDKLAAVTDGVTPSPEHVAASIALADSVRAISRGPDGDWKAPEDVAGSVPLATAMVTARTALHEAMDVARVQQAMTTRLILLGGLYARATTLPVTEERVAARARDGFVQIALDEAVGLRGAQAGAIELTDKARRHLALLRVPDSAPAPSERGPRQRAPQPEPPTARP
jgi:hypothetical protein